MYKYFLQIISVSKMFLSTKKRYFYVRDRFSLMEAHAKKMIKKQVSVECFVKCKAKFSYFSILFSSFL